MKIEEPNPGVPIPAIGSDAGTPLSLPLHLHQPPRGSHLVDFLPVTVRVVAAISLDMCVNAGFGGHVSTAAPSTLRPTSPSGLPLVINKVVASNYFV